ncbi:MAG TPA: AbrB/MazE/SpoVT family DNA-binding domain-containing protein [Thermoanaerobaculia bacterium]|nr:AbrB/MazE/SpoVT family DNA-binding domain-containing protein [Thermoanaerobaculia bacterium]
MASSSSVSTRGQTVIPADIRRRYSIEPGDQLLWLEDEAGLRVIPVEADALQALRGSGKGEGLLERLLEQRRRDRDRGC